MIPLLLGNTLVGGERVYLDPESLRTHLHLIGATGAGKSTAILTLLRSLLIDTQPKNCVFLLDPLGNLSDELLTFLAHPRLCTDDVRRRLVYIEPAREDVVLPFNPLTYTSEGNRYYQVMRAVDLVLRAWAAQDLSQQPRLLQWLYKAFCAAAMMGFPIAMSQFLVHPGTPEHEAMLQAIPGPIRNHWQRILRSHGEAERILESTRNRLDPFFESVNLKRMFGAHQSRFDCERFIRERRIVVVNLAKLGRVPAMTADTIGALMLNEIFETAARLTTTQGRAVVDPTYVIMDEFQKYVSVDIEDALPTVRQMGLRLVLAHQSFSQLERHEEVDLTQMIWQARTRLVFASNARDADLLADELAKLTFDPKRVKDLRTSLRQLITGYRKEWLESESSNSSRSDSSSEQKSTGSNQSRGETKAPGRTDASQNTSHGDQSGRTTGYTWANSSGETHGRSQANVPIHNTFEEVSSVTYQSFEEWALDWGKRIRTLRQGQAFLMQPGAAEPIPILVQHLPIVETSLLREAKAKLLEQNFASEFFISAAQADREFDLCRQRLLQGPTETLSVPADAADAPAGPADSSGADPFR